MARGHDITGWLATLSAITIFSMALLVPGNAGYITLPVLLLLFLVSIYRHEYIPGQVSLISLLVLAWDYFFADLQVWPLGLLVPIIIFVVVYAAYPKLRLSLTWLRKGDIATRDYIYIIAVTVISSLALVGWVLIMQPDLGASLAQMPVMPLWLIPIAGIGFALLNAVMEEFIFRGIVQNALDHVLGSGFWSVFIQAVPFASLHVLAGFPSGVAGFGMVFIYGLMLGTIARMTHGLAAPVFTHIAADLTIFTILAVIYF